MVNPFNISNFIANINKDGVIKSSNFDVLLFGPQGINDNETPKLIQMRCLEVDLPGRTVQTSESNIYGPIRKIATSSIMNDITLRFLLDEKFHIREYFEKWLDLIIGDYRTEETDGSMFDLGFYDDYVGNIEITQYNDIGEIKHKTKLLEVYPIIILEENLSWENGNQLITLPVTFCFRKYMNEH